MAPPISVGILNAVTGKVDLLVVDPGRPWHPAFCAFTQRLGFLPPLEAHWSFHVLYAIGVTPEGSLRQVTGHRLAASDIVGRTLPEPQPAPTPSIVACYRGLYLPPSLLSLLPTPPPKVSSPRAPVSPSRMPLPPSPSASRRPPLPPAPPSSIASPPRAPSSIASPLRRGSKAAPVLPFPPPRLSSLPPLLLDAVLCFSVCDPLTYARLALVCKEWRKATAGPSLQLSLLHTLPLAQVLLPPTAPSSLASLLATGLLGMCRLITRPSRSDPEVLEVEAPYTARVVGALASSNNLQQPIVRVGSAPPSARRGSGTLIPAVGPSGVSTSPRPTSPGGGGGWTKVTVGAPPPPPTAGGGMARRPSTGGGGGVPVTVSGGGSDEGGPVSSFHLSLVGLHNTPVTLLYRKTSRVVAEHRLVVHGLYVGDHHHIMPEVGRMPHTWVELLSITDDSFDANGPQAVLNHRVWTTVYAYLFPLVCGLLSPISDYLVAAHSLKTSAPSRSLPSSRSLAPPGLSRLLGPSELLLLCVLQCALPYPVMDSLEAKGLMALALELTTSLPVHQPLRAPSSSSSAQRRGSKDLGKGGVHDCLFKQVAEGSMVEGCAYPDLLSAQQGAPGTSTGGTNMGVRVLLTGTLGVDRYLQAALDARLDTARKWHRKRAGF